MFYKSHFYITVLYTSTLIALTGTSSPIEEAYELLKDIAVTKSDGKIFTDAIKIYNPEYGSDEPFFIVVANNLHDVQRSLEIAYKAGVRVAVKSGGHSFAGYSTIGSDGFVLSLEMLNSVVINGSQITAGVGARWLDVYSALDGTGYIAVGGCCTSVGLGGYVVGGGFGLQSRYRGGLASDKTLSFTMVTSDGTRVVTASHNVNTDLFWALRGGGGGNFGVIIDITMEVIVSPKIFYWSILYFRGSKIIETALKHIGENLEKFPRELNLDMILQNGQLRLDAVYTNINKKSVEKALSYFKPTKKLQPLLPTANFLEFITNYSDMHGYKRSEKYPVYMKGGFVQSLSPDFAHTLAHLNIPRGMILNMVHLGGDIKNFSPTETAFVHRDAEYVYYTYGRYTTTPQKNQVMRFSKKVYKIFKQSGCSKGGYVNYMDRYLKAWPEEYYGVNYKRLCEIKEKWNPVGKGGLHFQQEIGSAYSLKSNI